MNLADIQDCFERDAVFYTRHSKSEMQMEESGRISDREVGEALSGGEIIREYPDDKPYPSALIAGITAGGRALHVVCAFNQGERLAIVVTVYQPSPELWIEQKQRKP